MVRREESLERRKDERRSSGISLWPVIGGIAIVAAAAAVIISLPDIKRYIKISQM